MKYLYHLVPEQMIGTNIMPLNVLAKISQAHYREYMSRYKGREDVPKQRIPPPLDCLWNDVVFLSAVHPADILRAYESVGATLHRRKFYQIDAAALNPSSTLVWLFETRDKSAQSFVPFDLANLEHYSKVSDKTTNHYRKQIAAGNRILIFAHIPHILFKGTLDVSRSEIIEV